MFLLVPFICSLGLAFAIFSFVAKFLKPQKSFNLQDVLVKAEAKSDEDFEEAVKFTTRLTMLNDETKNTKELLALKLKPLRVRAGEVILRKGDISKEMYFIRDGRVAVCTHDGVRVFDHCNEGDIFGELALLYNMPRTATVKAETQCSLYVLTKSDFDVMRDHSPSLRTLIKNIAIERFHWFNDRLKHSFAEYGAYSEDQIAVFKQVFQDMDLDGNGTIDSHELGIMLWRLAGRKFSDAEVKALMNLIDTNQNNQIEFEEFIVGLHHLPVIRGEDKFQQQMEARTPRK